MATLLTTLTGPTPSSLLHSISKLSIPSTHHILYTLAANTGISQPDLSLLVSSLQRLTTSTIGCLSAPLSETGHILCAIAAFDSRHAIPFRSTAPGKDAVRVGRWHNFRDRHETKEVLAFEKLGSGEVDWNEVWNRPSKATPEVPLALRDISCVYPVNAYQQAYI